jgi:hypothetical protein
MSHTYSQNHLHIVFSTKERKRLIATTMQPRLWSYMAGIGRNHDNKGVNGSRAGSVQIWTEDKGFVVRNGLFMDISSKSDAIVPPLRGSLFDLTCPRPDGLGYRSDGPAALREGLRESPATEKAASFGCPLLLRIQLS